MNLTAYMLYVNSIATTICVNVLKPLKRALRLALRYSIYVARTVRLITLTVQRTLSANI